MMNKSMQYQFTPFILVPGKLIGTVKLNSVGGKIELNPHHREATGYKRGVLLVSAEARRKTGRAEQGPYSHFLSVSC